MKLNKTFIILSILAVIILSILGWYFLRPQGSIEFAVAPQEIQFTYGKNTQTIQHKQTIKLSPGIYETTFSRDGFQIEKKKIVIEKGKKNRIVIALTPLTDTAKKILADNSESQEVIKEYKKVRYAELIDSLPLSGVNYSITACRSVKYTDSAAKALCINTDTPEGEAAAKESLEQQGYNTDELELLIGNETTKSILKRDSYQIDYYLNVNTENSNKLALFITPLNVPYVPFTTALNPQLESIRTAALNDLTSNGYILDNYEIFYSNIYLSKYNSNSSESDEHAMPPIY